MDLYFIFVFDYEFLILVELLVFVLDISNIFVVVSNIIIFVLINVVFVVVFCDIFEGEVIEWKNDIVVIGVFLLNYVFLGYYFVEVVMDMFLFIQLFLDSSFENYCQLFGNFIGGQYNGVVRDGDDVVVIFGELIVLYVM